MDADVRGRLTVRSDLLIGLAGIATLVVVWCALTYGGLVQSLFLPTPSGIWEGLAEFHTRGWLFSAVTRSFWRVTQSLILVTLIGVPIGVLMGAFAPIDALTRKLVNAGKSIPTTGMIGLIVLWFGIDERGKIVFLFIGAIFYMVILVKNAVASVNEEYLRVAMDIGANRWQVLTRVLLPAALPQIWDTIAVCNGIMWTYIVLAEYINSNEDQLGLGYLLYMGARANESGKVFGTLILIGVISSLTDWFLQAIRRRFFNW